MLTDRIVRKSQIGFVTKSIVLVAHASEAKVWHRPARLCVKRRRKYGRDVDWRPRRSSQT